MTQLSFFIHVRRILKDKFIQIFLFFVPLGTSYISLYFIEKSKLGFSLDLLTFFSAIIYLIAIFLALSLILRTSLEVMPNKLSYISFLKSYIWHIIKVCFCLLPIFVIVSIIGSISMMAHGSSPKTLKFLSYLLISPVFLVGSFLVWGGLVLILTQGSSKGSLLKSWGVIIVCIKPILTYVTILAALSFLSAQVQEQFNFWTTLLIHYLITIVSSLIYLAGVPATLQSYLEQSNTNSGDDIKGQFE